MIVAANKCDLIPEGSDNLERLRAYVTERGYPFYEISAATTQGTKQLMRVIAGRLRELPPVTVYEPEYVKPLAEAGEADALSIEHMDDLWVVSGKWMQQLIADINFADYESRMYFDRQLRKRNPDCISIWRSGASRTATRSASTTLNLSTSDNYCRFVKHIVQRTQ